MVSEGRYVVDCSVDAFLTDSAGKVALARQSVDLYFKIELNLQKLVGRTVFVKIVFHDKIKNQSVSAVQKVNVEGGNKKVLDGI